MLYTHKRPEHLNASLERSDDIPMLIAHMRRSALPQTLDRHIPTRAYWGNLSIGWTAVVWLAHLLSCSDHKPSTVQQWVANHAGTLRWCTGSDIVPADVGLDRLSDVLIGLSQDSLWQAIEADLNRHALSTWELNTQQVHLRLYDGRSWHISPRGLFQISQTHPWGSRALRQTILLAMLSPSNLPLMVWTFPDNHISSLSFTSMLERIEQTLPPQRYRFIGDALAAVELRGVIHRYNHEYLCALPSEQPDPVNLTGDIVRADTSLPASANGNNDNNRPLPNENTIEWYVPMSMTIGDHTVTWDEQRIAVRSSTQAQALEEALRSRLARAEAALLALSERKRGKRRLRSLDALQEAAQAILNSYQVQGLLQLDFNEQIEERVVRRYRGRPTGVRAERDVYLSVSTDADALARAIQRLGWQMFGSNISRQDLSPDQVLSVTTPVSGFERLHGRPSSLSPHEVHTPELEIGLIRLLALGLRTLVLLETIARLQLIKEGLLPSLNDARAAARANSERLLDAFRDIMLTPGKGHLPRDVTPLSPLQQRVLHLVALPPEIYWASM